jgi:hypothetical protein
VVWIGLGKKEKEENEKQEKRREKFSSLFPTFFCSVSCCVVLFSLGPTQPPIQWVPGALSSEVKRPGREADHSPPTSQENVDLYIHSPIHLHGVMLN